MIVFGGGGLSHRRLERISGASVYIQLSAAHVLNLCPLLFPERQANLASVAMAMFFADLGGCGVHAGGPPSDEQAHASMTNYASINTYMIAWAGIQPCV